MWTTVEKIEITDDQQKSFAECGIKKGSLRRAFQTAMHEYTDGLTEVGTVEHDLWRQIADQNGFNLGDREYRLVADSKTLQSRPNRHGGGNCDVASDE